MVATMRLAAALLAAAILAMPARAFAVGEPNGVAFRFEYTPRPGCMGREDFADTWLRAAFGGEVVRDDARALVRVVIKRNGNLPEAHVWAFDEKGVERWQAVIPTEIDCRELIQDTAYALGANLGKWHLKRQPTPDWLLYQRPVEVGAPAPLPPVRAFVALVPPVPSWARVPVTAQVQHATGEGTREKDVRFEFGASGLVVPFGLPAVAFGGSLFVAARYSIFSGLAEFRGVGAIPREIGFISAQSVMWSGLGGLCADARAWLGFCGLLSGGRLGVSFDAPGRRVDWAANVLMMGGRIQAMPYDNSTVGVRLFVEALVPLRAPIIRHASSTASTITWEMPTPLVTAGGALRFWGP
jgi:hypothetical protein